jgi:hypothetical protein
MRKFVTKEIESDLLKLAIYQIIGGGVGILLVIWSALNLQAVNPASILLYLLMLSFFGYSIYCGILCGDVKENCLKHSLINQVLQVAGLAGFGYAYQFAAGFFVSIGLNLTQSPELDFRFGISSLDLQINTGGGDFKANVNVVAIGLILWINKTIRSIQNEKQFRKMAELGRELQLQEQ